MPTLIESPTTVPAPGVPPKTIDEYVRRVNSETDSVSIAHMKSPQGWSEPGQRPKVDEFTVVLKGTLRVEHADGVVDVAANQAIIAHQGEWVRYSTPRAGGAEYLAVCLPAFSPDLVKRDE